MDAHVIHRLQALFGVVCAFVTFLERREGEAAQQLVVGRVDDIAAR